MDAHSTKIVEEAFKNDVDLQKRAVEASSKFHNFIRHEQSLTRLQSIFETAFPSSSEISPSSFSHFHNPTRQSQQSLLGRNANWNNRPKYRIGLSPRRMAAMKSRARQPSISSAKMSVSHRHCARN